MVWPLRRGLVPRETVLTQTRWPASAALPAADRPPVPSAPGSIHRADPPAPRPAVAPLRASRGPHSKDRAPGRNRPGQEQPLIAAVGGDVGGLAVEIDSVFGIDFEMHGDSRINARWHSRPDPGVPLPSRSREASNSNAERRTPSLLKRETMLRGFIRGQGQRSSESLRRIERSLFDAPTPRTRFCPTQSSAMPLSVRRRSALSARKVSRYSAREGTSGALLGDTARNEIVDHHAEIAFGAIEHDWLRAPLAAKGRVKTCNKSPSCRSLS